MLSQLEKIKDTEIYQVYFVKAVEKSQKKVLFSYQVCLILLVWVYTLIPNLVTEFKPIEQLQHIKGTLVEVLPGGRGFNESIVVQTKYEKLTFVTPLLPEKYKYVENQLKSPVSLVYHYEFYMWPFKRKTVVNLIINHKIIYDYNKQIDWLKDNSLSKKTAVLCLIIIGVILLRIWKKYK